MARKVRPLAGHKFEDCIMEKDRLYQSDDYQAARDWNPGKECNLGGCRYSSTAKDICDLYKKEEDPLIL